MADSLAEMKQTTNIVTPRRHGGYLERKAFLSNVPLSASQNGRGQRTKSAGTATHRPGGANAWRRGLLEQRRRGSDDKEESR